MGFSLGLTITTGATSATLKLQTSQFPPFPFCILKHSVLLSTYLARRRQSAAELNKRRWTCWFASLSIRSDTDTCELRQHRRHPATDTVHDLGVQLNTLRYSLCLSHNLQEPPNSICHSSFLSTHFIICAQHDAAFCRLINQVAQLSQGNRAAGWVTFGRK